MKLVSTWKEKMLFTAEAGGQSALMDAKPPIGTGAALTPKELLAAAACGCTGMDVIALLRKHKQPVEDFEIEADVATSAGGNPVVFDGMTLTYRLGGPVDPARALEAVTLSQTKYCGVGAMLAKAFPIRYEVFLNGEKIGAGTANFTETKEKQA